MLKQLLKGVINLLGLLFALASPHVELGPRSRDGDAIDGGVNPRCPEVGAFLIGRHR